MKVHKLWAAVGTALAILASALAVVAAPSAQAQTYSVLHKFDGKHGQSPFARLIHGRKGNLYGTTYAGGAYGYGIVFKLETNGKEKVLHSFSGGADGAYPYAGVVRDSVGNLYGTTMQGGAYNVGVVFKLDATGAVTVLHNFTGGADGREPWASLVRDSDGNFYGTARDGGVYDDGGHGVVFKLDTTGAETVLYSFTGGADGDEPLASVVRDQAGNLYGTTKYGGAYRAGVVFKLDTTGAETVLHSFSGGADGFNPQSGVVRDSANNLYGTTSTGGASGYGVVFKLDTTGAETVLHSFTGGADGREPYAGLVRDSVGNLYGTTVYGGAYDRGVVFKLDATGTETVLHSFSGADGVGPFAGLVRDSVGNFYGTTYDGGAHRKGVVFKITPQ